MTDIRKAIEDYARAWSTNDRALLLSLFAEDAIWMDPVGTPPFKGHAGVGKFWDFAHQDAERTMHAKAEEIRVCGSEGILRFTMQVRIPHLKQGLDLSVIDVFEFDAKGKIKSAKAFWDESSVSTPPGLTLFAPNVSEAYEK